MHIFPFPIGIMLRVESKRRDLLRLNLSLLFSLHQLPILVLYRVYVLKALNLYGGVLDILPLQDHLLGVGTPLLALALVLLIVLGHPLEVLLLFGFLLISGFEGFLVAVSVEVLVILLLYDDLVVVMAAVRELLAGLVGGLLEGEQVLGVEVEG